MLIVNLIGCVKAFSCKFQVSRGQAATITHMIREVSMVFGLSTDG